MRAVTTIVALLLVLASRAGLAQRDSAASDTISVHLVEVDFRIAVQTLAQYLDHPVLMGNVAGTKVTFDTPRPVARREVLGLLRSLVESQNDELVQDSSGVYRVRAREQRPPAPAPPAPRQVGLPALFVIHLSHARAPDVAATVNALYGRASAIGEIAGPPSTLPEQLRQNQVPPAGAAQLAPGAVGRVAQLTGEVTIVPDAGTNSLLIRASHSDFDLISAAVQELDVRPLQVLVEVLIAEIRKDQSGSLGLATALGATSVGARGTTVTASTQGLSAGDLVIGVMHLNGNDLAATLAASASRGDVRILSRPVVLAANNEAATINVGSQRPFIQVSRSLPTDAPQRDQVVQYKDVGTRLSVRPTISGNGYVTLEVSQEVNAATSEFAFDAPVISTRSVQTRLLIKDGQTVIIGGLSDQQQERSHSGVPFLSDLPLVGTLFGSRSHTSTETELYLFITPRILQSDADADSVTAPRRRAAGDGPQ